LAQQASGSALGKRDPVTANSAIISFFMIDSPLSSASLEFPLACPPHHSCILRRPSGVSRRQIHTSPAAQRALARITTIQHVSLITD
jgi:hypothetical protein